VRYKGQNADVLIGNQQSILRNWSLGGVAFDAPHDSRLAVGDRVEFVLQFRFPHETVRVRQAGRVIRAGRLGAVTTLTLDDDSRRQLTRVLDNQNTQDFLLSQVA
jgi:hypothetical protein